MAQAQEVIGGERALTISRYAWVTDIVADVRIENANEAAAKIYGYNNPEELIGTFLSETMSKEDMLRGSLISLSQLKRGETNRYVQRIQQPGGKVTYASKETYRIRRGNDIQYVTFLEPADESAMEPLPTPERLGITDEDVLAYRGKMSVRELRELMQNFGVSEDATKSLTPFDMNTILSIFQTSGTQQIGALHVVTTKLSPPKGEPIELLPGQTRVLPDRRYLHRCGKCLRIWHSTVENPTHCPRARTDKTGPKCGVRTWRFYQPS